MLNRSKKETLIFKSSYGKDNDYSIQMVRWFLKPIGAWPRTASTSWLDTLIAIGLIVLCLSLILCTMIPCALYILVEEKVIRLKIRAFGPLSFWMMSTVKYYLLFLNAEGIKGCLQHIETDWKQVKSEDDRQIMLKNAKIGRYIAGYCIAFMHSGMFSYDIARWFTTIKVVVGNESVPMHMLPLPFYNGIVDTHSSPAYEIVFGLQCVSSFIVNSITAGGCSLATIFVMHACGQLDVVMSWLDKLIEEKNFQTRQADLVECHLRVLSFMGRIEDVINQICFAEMIICTLDMCLLGYYFITELEQHETANTIGYPIVFIAITFTIFIYCYIGEILSEQCRQVGEVAYMADWYRLPNKNALGFILIICRSRSVVHLTAGKLIQMSIATFGSVIRTSVAYLNILRQVT